MRARHSISRIIVLTSVEIFVYLEYRLPTKVKTIIPGKFNNSIEKLPLETGLPFTERFRCFEKLPLETGLPFTERFRGFEKLPLETGLPFTERLRWF